MFKKSNLQNYLFFDIETMPAYDSFNEMPEAFQKLWLEKHHTKGCERVIENFFKEKSVEEVMKSTDKGAEMNVSTAKTKSYTPKVNTVYIGEAGLYPEFAKIFCISFGVFDKDFNINVNTLHAADEKEILEQFLEVLNHFNLHLFGYNINDFDIPFLLKRLWLNGFVGNYPAQLQLGDAKPWTVKHIDLMQTYKSFNWAPIGLALLCESLGIPSPKDKFNNSDFTTLLKQGKITPEEAIEYCEKDVTQMMLVALKLSSEESNYFPQVKKASSWSYQSSEK